MRVRALPVRKYTGKAKRVRKGGRKTLRVRVRPGTVHKRGVGFKGGTGTSAYTRKTGSRAGFTG